jgi:hypothetical protein
MKGTEKDCDIITQNTDSIIMKRIITKLLHSNGKRMISHKSFEGFRDWVNNPGNRKRFDLSGCLYALMEGERVKLVLV